MAARLDSVAKFICERGDWKITNLQLQKVIYMAQMIHLGRYDGVRLVDADFEAWDYGPVEPNLYHKVKMFGSEPIDDVFFEARYFKKDDERRTVLIEVCDGLLTKRPGELVDITHWRKGAWAKYYVPGSRYIRIPDAAIAQEYHDRLKREQRSDSIANA
jgi:uncharacterized phage-associated protein